MLSPLLVSLLVGNSCFSAYLLYRQYRAMSKPQPSHSKKIYSDKEFKDSVAYGEARYSFKILMCLVDILKELSVLALLPYAYEKAFRNLSSSEELLVIFHSLLNTVLAIPSDLYYDFVIEAKHGFNKKTLGTFVKDLFLGALITSIISYCAYFVIFKLIKAFSSFYLYVWLFVCCFYLMLYFLYPTLIQPLFNTFTPLEDGPLKEKIHSLAQKVGFKIDKIMVMDGSKRTGHANAYFTGLGPVKRIVFFDTILEELKESDDEVLAILCHEFGHWAKSHLLLKLLQTFAISFIYIYLLNCMLVSFRGISVALNVIRAFSFLSVISIPIRFIGNTLSRIMERQADSFAVDLGYGHDLKEGLSKIVKKSKVSPIVDPLYSALNFSHPPILERIEYIDGLIAKKE